jgi:hypothetical protein
MHLQSIGVLKFTRKLYTDEDDPEEEEPLPDSQRSRPNIFEIPNEVNFLFDGSLETTPMRSKPAEDDKVVSKPTVRPRKGNWHVKMQWNPEIAGEQSVSTSTIVSLALVPPTAYKANGTEQDALLLGMLV